MLGNMLLGSSSRLGSARQIVVSTRPRHPRPVDATLLTTPCGRDTTHHPPRKRTLAGFAGTSAVTASGIPRSSARPMLRPFSPTWASRAAWHRPPRTRPWRRCFSSTVRCWTSPGPAVNAVRANRPARLPVVLTREVAMVVIDQLSGATQLMAMLLCAIGLRALECGQPPH